MAIPPPCGSIRAPQGAESRADIDGFGQNIRARVASWMKKTCKIVQESRKI
jgi:hypothetical protein